MTTSDQMAEELLQLVRSSDDPDQMTRDLLAAAHQLLEAQSHENS